MILLFLPRFLLFYSFINTPAFPHLLTNNTPIETYTRDKTGVQSLTAALHHSIHNQHIFFMAVLSYLLPAHSLVGFSALGGVCAFLFTRSTATRYTDTQHAFSISHYISQHTDTLTHSLSHYTHLPSLSLSSPSSLSASSASEATGKLQLCANKGGVFLALSLAGCGRDVWSHLTAHENAIMQNNPERDTHNLIQRRRSSTNSNSNNVITQEVVITDHPEGITDENTSLHTPRNHNTNNNSNTLKNTKLSNNHTSPHTDIHVSSGTTQLVFLNSHLNAFAYNAAERNRNIHAIFSALSLLSHNTENDDAQNSVHTHMHAPFHFIHSLTEKVKARVGAHFNVPMHSSFSLGGYLLSNIFSVDYLFKNNRKKNLTNYDPISELYDSPLIDSLYPFFHPSLFVNYFKSNGQNTHTKFNNNKIIPSKVPLLLSSNGAEYSPLCLLNDYEINTVKNNNTNINLSSAISLFFNSTDNQIIDAPTPPNTVTSDSAFCAVIPALSSHSLHMQNINALNSSLTRTTDSNSLSLSSSSPSVSVPHSILRRPQLPHRPHLRCCFFSSFTLRCSFCACWRRQQNS